MSSSGQLETLTSRLDALSDIYKETLQLINRLSKLSFQPGSSPLDESPNGNVSSELSSEIHQRLNQQEEQLEQLRQEVEDITVIEGHSNIGPRGTEKDKEKARLTIQVRRLGEDLRLARSTFRKAQLQAKQSAQKARQRERQLLFQGVGQNNGSETASIRRKGQDKSSSSSSDQLVTASGDVTAALRRTHRLLQTELSRSHFAQETFDQSTAALNELSSQYSDLDTLLSSSRNLLSTLVTSQKSDTWYLETAFYILIATISWLVFRRFLYGPLWWLLWLPLKLVYRTLFGILVSIGLSGKASAVSSPSSILASSSAASDVPVAMSSSSEKTANISSGSAGSGKDEDPSPKGSMSQNIGKMVEEGQKRTPKELVVRGDGTVLPESNEPRNPKKRMFEAAPVEPEKQSQETGNQGEKDEL